MQNVIHCNDVAQKVTVLGDLSLFFRRVLFPLAMSGYQFMVHKLLLPRARMPM